MKKYTTEQNIQWNIKYKGNNSPFSLGCIWDCFIGMLGKCIQQGIIFWKTKQRSENWHFNAGTIKEK